MSQEQRAGEPKALLFALLAAATVCAIGMFLGAVLMSDTQAPAELLPWAALYFLGGLWVAALAGLPTFLVLRRWRLARWWIAISVGAVFGVAFSWVLNQGFEHIASMAAIGAASAVAFWSTWRKLTGEAHAT